MWPFRSEEQVAAENAEIDRQWRESLKDPDWWPNGAPKRLEALSTESSKNRPTGCDLFDPHTLDDHLRAAYAMIAQLRDRVEALEKK